VGLTAKNFTTAKYSPGSPEEALLAASPNIEIFPPTKEEGSGNNVTSSHVPSAKPSKKKHTVRATAASDTSYYSARTVLSIQFFYELGGHYQRKCRT